MAQKVHYSLVDDLDGSAADQTVKFGLDGAEYQIDLSKANADKLRNLLAPYVGHGRRVGGRRTTSRRGGRDAASETAKIREWAKANGHKVSDRGRIPAPVVEAYRKAH